MLRPLSEIPDFIERLAAKGKTRGRTWTLAQIADHLARAIEWQLNVLPTEGMPRRLPPLWLRRILRPIFLRSGRLPANVPSIASTLAPDDVDLHAAISRLRRAIESLQTAPESYAVHPYLGAMRRKDWIRFHEVHAAHHLRAVQ